MHLVPTADTSCSAAPKMLLNVYFYSFCTHELSHAVMVSLLLSVPPTFTVNTKLK